MSIIASRVTINKVKQLSKATLIRGERLFHDAAKTVKYGKKPSVSFLSSLEIKDIEASKNVTIGNTPLVEVEDSIFAKLEGQNPSGSLKDRTVSAMVFGMISEGKLRKGDTLCLMTSGSAGVSLLTLQSWLEELELNINVVVAMPKAYARKQIPARCIKTAGVSTFYESDSLLTELQDCKRNNNSLASVLLMDGTFIEGLAELKGLVNKHNWKILDQHFDDNAVVGHKSTAQEIMAQCPSVTDVVCATGTGATAAGLMEYLPDHVKVHSRPAESGGIDGLSDVNRYDNFCKSDELEGYNTQVFDVSTALNLQKQLNLQHGILAGPSSGATYWLAQKVLDEKPEAKVVFISADGRHCWSRLHELTQQRAELDLFTKSKPAFIQVDGRHNPSKIHTRKQRERHGVFSSGLARKGRRQVRGGNRMFSGI